MPQEKEIEVRVDSIPKPLYFPAGTNPEVIQMVVKKMLAERGGEKPPVAPEQPGVVWRGLAGVGRALVKPITAPIEMLKEFRAGPKAMFEESPVGQLTQGHYSEAAKRAFAGTSPFSAELVQAYDRATKHKDITGALTEMLTDLALMRGVPKGAKATGRTLGTRPLVVRETVFSEGQAMLNAAESAARTKAKAMFPESTATIPAETLADIGERSALEIKGTAPVPKPIKALQVPITVGTTRSPAGKVTAHELVGTGMRRGTLFERLPDSVKAANPEVAQILREIEGVSGEVPIEQVHRWYSELGALKQKKLQGDIYAGVNRAHTEVGQTLAEVYRREGKYEQWQAAKKNFENVAKDWWSDDSPLAQARGAKNSTDFFAALTGPDKLRARAALTRYKQFGALPEVIDASALVTKGYKMGQMPSFGGLKWRLQEAPLRGALRYGATRPGLFPSLRKTLPKEISTLEELGRSSPFQQRIEQQMTQRLAAGTISKNDIIQAAIAGDIDPAAPGRIFRAVGRVR